MRKLLPFLFLTPLFLIDASADVPAPKFEQFSVARERVRKPIAVKLTDEKSLRYATRLREFANRQPNFAGHFILASWGCGASCVITATINAQTGEVVWLPFTVCCWNADVSKPLEFHADSRLLIVHGSRNETGNGTYDYVFDGRQFTLLKAEEAHLTN